MSIYRRVLRYYQPFWGKTILGLFLSLIGIGLNLLKPWPFKIIVDDFLRPTPADRGDWRTWIPLLCLALVVIQFAWGIINWITNYLFVKIGLQALLKLRTDLYSHLQRLSLKFHDARRSADSSFRVAYDSQSIQTIYNKGFTNIFASVIALIGTFIVMLRLDWVLTLLSLAIVPLIVGAIYLFASRIRSESTSIQEQEQRAGDQHTDGHRNRSDVLRRNFTCACGHPQPRFAAGVQRLPPDAVSTIGIADVHCLGNGRGYSRRETLL